MLQMLSFLQTTTCSRFLTNQTSQSGQCKIRSTPFPKAITVLWSWWVVTYSLPLHGSRAHQMGWCP